MVLWFPATRYINCVLLRQAAFSRAVSEKVQNTKHKKTILPFRLQSGS